MSMMSRFLFLSLFCFVSVVLHIKSLSFPSNFNLTTTNNSSSSSSSSLPAFNITRGSSISASNQTTSYWLSPSGIFAFGFHPLCYDCSEYQVAIWINKPSKSNEVVVWSLQHDSAEPIYDGASIQLNHDGVFMIRQENFNTLKPLFNIALAPASYASMEDNGNFLVYNSDLNVIWESSSYLTDTILQGQTLKSGESLLVSNTGYRLVMQTDGNLELIDDNGYDLFWRRTSIIEWESATRKEAGGGHGIILNLDSSGHMYLVDKDGIVIKNLTKENHQSRSSDSDIIYRSTLDSDGIFRLYGEKIRSDESFTVHCVPLTTRDKRSFAFIVGMILMGAAIILTILGCLVGIWRQCTSSLVV